MDAIVERPQMRENLGSLLALHEERDLTGISEMPEKEIQMVSERYGRQTGDKQITLQKKDAWERVQVSRKKDRPVGSDYIQALFTDFREFHGDRLYGDDPAVIGGIATFGDRAVTVIVQEKGSSTRENIQRNFAMPKPEGYRKALRLMKQAEKFHRPVICFVDTPGAFCGIEAEERGQGEAIARNIYEMSSLKVPVLTVIIGEGGSGGALAMDNVISEPEEFSRENLYLVTGALEEGIDDFLNRYNGCSAEELLEHRYRRFREM